ncbi:MAG: DedA family protein [Candidatus Vogelbacteria bacterium]|nr:DedA family protein [Candidatus Vogelbacteria bacterium]
MHNILEILKILLHLDTYLITFTNNYGGLVYSLLFIVIFCETGLVISPFLPGDSLLFAAGAIAASSGSLNIEFLFMTIATAAILGDSLNYSIGKVTGTKIFLNTESRVFKKEYLTKTENFYEHHGNKAILLGRFFPIIRTFVPFVAGIGKMNYGKFLFYNILGGIIWTIIFLLGGYTFGNIQFVKNNFTIVIFSIIFLSFLPGIYHLIRSWYKQKNQIL